MANAIEDALNRMNPEQRAKTQQVIEEARRNIKLVSMRDEVTPHDADAIGRQAQVIEEAKRTIPFETMHDVDSIDTPLPTPVNNNKARYMSKVVELHPQTQDNIERIEQGKGNNYLRENAVDHAEQRQPQPVQEQEQQKAMER